MTNPDVDAIREKYAGRTRSWLNVDPADITALLKAVDERDAKLALYQRPEGTYLSAWGVDKITSQAAELEAARERIDELETARGEGE